MLKMAWAIALKDLRLTLLSAGAFFQPLLLGLLLIFLFSLAMPPGESIPPQGAATVFWIGCVFCQVLVFHELYALEEVNGVRECLLLTPAPIQGVWLGKGIAGLVLVLLTQILLLPATVVFLNQTFTGTVWTGMVAIGVADVGIAALGSLLGALAQGQSGKESLLSIVIFPLLIPLLLAAISLMAESFGARTGEEPRVWLQMAIAFDATFLAAGLFLFGFLYGGEE